ncbi:MAG: hypothetical protein C4337_08645 [Armatimonadota bacterium]
MRTRTLITLLTLITTMTYTQTQIDTEFRGFWVDGFNEGFHTPEEVETLLRRVRNANMNAVIVQMRKRGDAHYLSPLEPFASNQKPNFDALAYLIEKAKSETPPIEVHVWVNCHPIWPGSGWPSDPKHILNRAPEIQTENFEGERITEVGYGMDWGHPLANEWFARVVLDIVRRYDIDGIHFDYIRYTGERWGYNPVSVERFNRRYGRTGKPEPTDPLWKQWRRDQVTAVVRKIATQARTLKPQLKVSAALITWGDGPQNDEDWVNRSAYSRVFQDWRGWLEEGLLDMAIPMVYYAHANPERARFYQNWIRFLKDHQYGRHGVVGIGNYLNTWENTAEQVRLARAPSPRGNRTVGVNLFSYAATSGRGSETGAKMYEEGFYAFLRALFPEWVPTPPMDWKRFPTTGSLMGTLLHARDLTPIDGAVVELYRNGTLYKTLTTDGTGFFAGVHLPPGTYALIVRAPEGTAFTFSALQVVPGLTTAFHQAIGDSDALHLNSVRSLDNLPEGTKVLLVGKQVVETVDERAPSVRVRNVLDWAEVTVFPKTRRFPWLQGERVAVLGTVHVLPSGTRQIADAEIRWLGVQ